MFTVNIEGPDGLLQLIESWESVKVIRKGHSTFEDEMKSCGGDISDGFAILYGAPSGARFFLNNGCKCYVTNSAGKTIASIK